MDQNTSAHARLLGRVASWTAAGAAALAGVGFGAGVALAATPPSVHARPIRAFAVGTFSAYGKVASVNAQALILTAPNGYLIAVNVPSGVAVRDGLTSSSLSSITTGEYAQATFRWGPNGLVATAVTYDATPFATGVAHPLFGRVSSTGANDLVLTLASGKTVSVSLFPGAKVTTGGKASSLAILATGDFARLSVRSGHGVNDAVAVAFSATPFGLAQRAIVGTVASVAGATVSITSAGGQPLSALVAATARVTAAGQTVTLASLTSGTKVRLLGWWFDHVFYARRVTVIAASKTTPASTSSSAANA